MADLPPVPGQPGLLRRSRTNKMIAGVCGGIGRYLGVDPLLIRIAFVVLAIAGGGGFLLYIIAWILMPEGPADEPADQVHPSSAESARLIFGGALVAIGVILLLGLSLPRIGKYLWPLALIALGLAVIVQASVRR
jgi:phage shock protein C